MASAAPSPHSPPMPMPYSSRRMISTVKFGANAHRKPTHRVEDHVHHQRQRRPTRSAHSPKISAPTGRMARVAVVTNATSALLIVEGLRDVGIARTPR